MTNDIRLAFSHPLERAEATADAAPRDRISLRDCIREVEIGAFQSERGVMQRVRFNVVVEVIPAPMPIDDDVDRVLSYDRIAEAIDLELAAERVNLLETLAERIAARILSEPRACRVFLRIEKLDRAPGALGVEIVRSRQGAQLAPVDEPDARQILRPVVVHLTNAMIAAPGLPEWLDAIEAMAHPAVLTVGLPGLRRPRAAHPLAQRRIDLLAIEQNAWVLAGRDPRCVVVDSRTELEWAMKHHHLSVWAPTKLVLDTRAEDLPPVTDPAALAVWLGGKFEAVAAIAPGGGAGEARAGLTVLAAEEPLAALEGTGLLTS